LSVWGRTVFENQQSADFCNIFCVENVMWCAMRQFQIERAFIVGFRHSEALEQ